MTTGHTAGGGRRLRRRRAALVAVTAAASMIAVLAACGGGRTSDAGPADAGSGADTDSPSIVIGELLVDPRAVPDERGEWVVLRNTGARPVELHGWSLRSANDPGFRIAERLLLAPDSTVLIARDTDVDVDATDSGIRARLRLSGITLANGGDWLALVTPDGVTADSIAWRGSTPGATMSTGDLRPPPAAPPGDQDGRQPATPGVRSPRSTQPPTTQPPTTQPLTVKPVTVQVLDVGQGDAILISNGESRVLVDGGPDPARMGRLLDSLDLNGRTIDVVILTHQHYDHHGGLRALFDTRHRIGVRYFFENRDPYANAALARLRDSVAARARRGELVARDTDDPCANGQPMCTITLRGGALLHIMRPHQSGGDANDRSAAVKLVGPDSASFTMWLAGDAERSSIDWFDSEDYDRRPGMDVNVLKLDHHGSCDGITARYLALTTPDWAVASLAARNEYGFIHSQTSTLLRQHSVPWYRTDANGTITIASPGTVGGGYTITPSRGERSASGPMDRRAKQGVCRTM